MNRTAPPPRPMRQPLRRHLRRTLIALLCVQLVGNSGVAFALKYMPDGVRWPAPATPSAQSSDAMPMAPNFNAPSATHCTRPVQTVEVPGGSREVQMREDEAASMARGPGRERMEKESKAEARAVEKRHGAADLAAAPPAALAANRTADAAVASGKADAERMTPTPSRDRQQQAASVTAGMVDDNANFAAYLQFKRKNAGVLHRERNVSERYLLQVRNAAGQAVPDAEVALHADNGAAMWARTDSSGRAWLHPLAVDPQGSASYEVAIRKDARQARGVLTRGQKSAVDITLDTDAQPQRARLDLVFLVDATGSMGDEIGKLRASLHSIADEMARLPSQPDLCFGLVAYRDRGDAFLMRRHNLSNDLTGFQGALDVLQADGGGDYPEAMNEAFHDTVHNIDWRGGGTTRLVVLLADAPPHLDYGGPQYDQDMLAALGKGIKVFSVGASGLDRQGEYVQRQIAQYTGGRFVFLTYQDARNPGSGPGRETVHDVRNYSVQTLDKLIVRLVSEELEKLPGGKG